MTFEGPGHNRDRRRTARAPWRERTEFGARCRLAIRSVALLGVLLPCLAATAEAGASLVEPRQAPRSGARSWVEFGPYVSFPVPAADVGSSQLGIDAGVSLSAMKGDGMGPGVDFAYHYWPASSNYRGAFDRYLRSNRFESLAGPDWACSVFQLTGHLKFLLPGPEAVRPWLQVGAGAYRVDYDLDERVSAGATFSVGGEGLGNVRIVGGGYASTGLDFLSSSSGVAWGVDATFHYLVLRKTSGWGNDLPDMSAFSLGTHVQFGR